MKPIPNGRARLASIAAVLLLAACSQAIKQTGPQEPSADTACALDGMVLKDFPGPKAQIQYSEGKPDFYCDLMELFAVVLAPEQKRSVAGLFVQDMGHTDWAHPQGHWIAAKGASYVVGSRKTGSMGPALASFATAADASAFAQAEGGKVMPFAQITAAMLRPSGAAHGMAMAKE